MSVLLSKLKEIMLSVLPIVVIVLLLHFFVTPIPTPMLFRFLIGAVFVIIGLSIFLFGADIGISPLGSHIGNALSRSNKVWIVAVVGLILGFFICIAEPDIKILAQQVSTVTNGVITSGSLLVVVSSGVAVLLVVGLVRIVFNLAIQKVLVILYGIILVCSVFVPKEFLAISFDASGATTGALTVPFILALAHGVSSLKKDSLANEEDNFGLVAITSTGAILSVLIMGIITNVTGLSGELPQHEVDSMSYFGPFIEALPEYAAESLIAILPLIVIFIAFQLKAFKFPWKPFRRILKGMLYTYIGLVIFLVGVNGGFMDIGTAIGRELVGTGSRVLPVVVGFLIGFVTILAEPAVHVLTEQVEDVTSGYVRRGVIFGALTIGVGLAVALSVVRILVPSIQLWHYLLPGYIISIAMSFFVPPLFVGIAFDSGGVASGPMTATFILAFVQGIADAADNANVLQDAFGMIAMVALMPIITLQTLGIIVKIKSRKKVREDTNG